MTVAQASSQSMIAWGTPSLVAVCIQQFYHSRLLYDVGMLTNQEMFDRAVRGLASQGWRGAIKVGSYDKPICAYLTNDGRRCAWGWVDTSLASETQDVSSLHYDVCYSLAKDLDYDGLVFAKAMQRTHDDVALADTGEEAESMKNAFAKLSKEFGLTWPDDVPQ